MGIDVDDATLVDSVVVNAGKTDVVVWEIVGTSSAIFVVTVDVDDDDVEETEALEEEVPSVCDIVTAVEDSVDGEGAGATVVVAAVVVVLDDDCKLLRICRILVTRCSSSFVSASNRHLSN